MYRYLPFLLECSFLFFMYFCDPLHLAQYRTTSSTLNARTNSEVIEPKIAHLYTSLSLRVNIIGLVQTRITHIQILNASVHVYCPIYIPYFSFCLKIYVYENA